MGNDVYTIPQASEIKRYAEALPAYMYINDNPQAVVFEGILTDFQIDFILDQEMGEPSYRHDSCGATTRECKENGDLYDLRPISDIAKMANSLFFDFDINMSFSRSWLQTYEYGEDYPVHSDGSPGQSRKLTAVALLTDPKDYAGGSLEVDAFENWYQVPNTKGTVVVFPGWVRHRVTRVVLGQRQSINMGFWGPPFR